MANKYIIEGATYNGDGTSSTEATANGGVGAWNTITYFEGAAPAYGALAASDVVYIRSKTKAGADITRTLTGHTSIGSANGTNSNFITWILDNGAIWSGVSGILTYKCDSGYQLTLVANNAVIASEKNAIVVKELNDTLYGAKTTFVLNSPCWAENFYFDFSVATVNGSMVKTANTTGTVTLKNPTIKAGNKNIQILHVVQGGVLFQVINPEIEMLNAAANFPVFYVGEYGQATVEVFGGRIFGVGANATGPSLCTLITSSSMSAVGLRFPATMVPTKTQIGFPGTLNIFAPDSGVAGSYVDRWGFADSRADGYYPTLNSFLPNSVQSPWSWKLLPKWCNILSPMRMNVAKLYIAEPAAKTVTAELLIANLNATLNRNTLWIDVTYIDDATGAAKMVTSRLTTTDALDSSSANWTTTTYGPTLFIKKKLSVTMPTAIKKDTSVSVMLRGTAVAASDNDVIFFCPDVVLT